MALGSACTTSFLSSSHVLLLYFVHRSRSLSKIPFSRIGGLANSWQRVARLLFSMAHALARSSDPAHRTKHMVLILHAANIALTSEDRSCFRSSTASSPASKICASAVITSIISSKHFGVTGVPTATAIDADVVAALDIVHKPHRRLQLPGG